MSEFLEQIIESEDGAEVWAMHVAKMAEYGFDRLIYGYTRFRNNGTFGDKNDLIVYSNYPPEYMEGFFHSDLYLDAPLLKWAANNAGARSWRLTPEEADSLTEAQQAVLEFNRQHGVVAGYTISFRDGSLRNKGAIGLAAAPGIKQDEVEEIWAEHGRQIVMLNTVVHLRLINLPFAPLSHQLTKRQREVLEWVRDGKTTQDIADIMGLTLGTVEKHLRLAREALHVETTAQAVLKATFHNQIFNSDNFPGNIGR